MKPRIRSIRNLFFRWGRLFHLEAEECAIALEDAGLIELTVDRLHYSESTSARAMTPRAFDSRVHEILMTKRFEKGVK